MGATVIEQVTRNLRQEYTDRGKVEVYEALKDCLNGRLAPESYAEVAARLA